MSIAIMQPYFLPHIGYFQLINAVDEFVFYDDVNYIKKGYINRNSILLNDKPYQFTIPLKKASQNKAICEIEVLLDKNWLESFFKTLKHSYKNAPNYKIVVSLLNEIFNSNFNFVSELSINSVELVCSYLDLEKAFYKSSSTFTETKDLDKSDRLIAVSKITNNRDYINTVGGKALYSKDYFKSNGIDLYFIESEDEPYRQFGGDFINHLSIIDVLMFNSKAVIKSMLNKYRLV